MEQIPEEYELVPKNQLEQLQHDVEKVKRNPFGDTASSKDLLTALDHLNHNVSKLIRIFETANDEIVRDYKDQANTLKINKVLEQNEKLAKGIVAIADLLREEHKNRTSSQNGNESFNPQMSSMNGSALSSPNMNSANGGMTQTLDSTFQSIHSASGTPNPNPTPNSSQNTNPNMNILPPQQRTSQGAPTFKPEINLNDVPPPPPR